LTGGGLSNLNSFLQDGSFGSDPSQWEQERNDIDSLRGMTENNPNAGTIRDALSGQMGTKFDTTLGKKNPEKRAKTWDAMMGIGDQGKAKYDAFKAKDSKPAGGWGGSDFGFGGTGGSGGGTFGTWGGTGGTGGGGFGTGDGTGSLGGLYGDSETINTGITPVAPYSKQMTQEAVNSARQGIDQQAYMPHLLAQGQREGVRSDASLSNVANAYNMNNMGAGASAAAGVQIPMQHGIANAQSMLAGQTGRAKTFADWVKQLNEKLAAQDSAQISSQAAGYDLFGNLLGGY